jgi:hypothetical protein
MPKVLITTIPFADKNKLPLYLLEENNIEYLINPINKKLTEGELTDMVADFDVIIEGNYSGHYVRTPYAYQPKLGRKYIPSKHVDLGQGLLQVITDLDSFET